MASKYKMTGCARFFIVLLILIPIAYFVASYITGDDGKELFNDLIGTKGEKTEQVEQSEELESSSEGVFELTDLQEEIKMKKEIIDSLKSENRKLQERIQVLQKRDTVQ